MNRFESLVLDEQYEQCEDGEINEEDLTSSDKEDPSGLGTG